MSLIRRITGCLALCAAALASGAPQGTAPRNTPEKYAAHAELNGVVIGATMLAPGQVRKALTTDVGRCCRVVEVALYPPKDGNIEVSLSDFTLRVAGEDAGAKPSTPKVAALRSSQDRDRLRPTLILAMEQELGERALPMGPARAAVSGYLYFSLPSNKKARYELEYMQKGNKAVLDLQ